MQHIADAILSMNEKFNSRTWRTNEYSLARMFLIKTREALSREMLGLKKYT